jgi:hypothetical protein
MDTKRRNKALLRAAVAGFCTIALSAQAGIITTLRADRQYLGGEFATTTASAPAGGGATFYNQTVLTPPGANTLYITLSTQGDTHGGAALQVLCLVNGIACNPNGAGAADVAPQGWVTLTKLPAATGGASNCDDGGGGAGDCHDQTVAYRWCARLPVSALPALRNVQLRLASSDGVSTVFIENATTSVDANVGLGGVCAVVPDL